MLKVRVIPTLLWKDFGLVKGMGFDSWRRVGAVLPAVKIYNLREVDELILLDITATHEKRHPDFISISEFAQECFCPLTVGGGISNLEDVKSLLRAGADKVCINSAAYENPYLISEIADRFGSQCVVVSIDVQPEREGQYFCFSHSGTRNTGEEVQAWARKAEEMGAGEIMICSIPRDGTMQGYDLDLIKQVSDCTHIPVIASGGAGNYEDLYQAVSQGHASAVAAASIFHFTEQTPLEAKKYLAEHGVMVRNVNRQLGEY